ncbi:MAG: AbrB/MazE/SpoVT family DNA-binding domain-containing protein [Candidatus Nanohaloarchaea archaeon]|nr:AbrB/MazE/SpoVT family DNA-binding domain-containing protein [Candidatus Nanohaloarchaea archaeon]
MLILSSLHRVDVFTREERTFNAELDSRGRVVVPAAVRRKLDLDKNSQLRLQVVEVMDDGT